MALNSYRIAAPMHRLSFWLSVFFSLPAATPVFSSPMLVYFGTYTQTASKGIYSIRFDPASGSMSAPELAGEARNPTFISLDPTGRFLYATGELAHELSPGKPAGGASAFAVERPSGKLRLINTQETGAGATTHNAVDATGRMLVLANYSAGYIAAVTIKSDGSLGPRSAYFDQNGKAPLGPNAERQQQSHAHSVTISPDNRFVFACDLGLDRVFGYKMDPSNGSLQPNDPPAVAAPPGAGPRHSKFSPDGRFLYVANEMGATVTRYAYDARSGALAREESVTTLPPGVILPDNTVAELRLHPSGKFLYASNRGHDSIAIYAVDLPTGKLTPVAITPCGGKHPRNFALDPSGRWLLCANRDTNNVVLFAVDPASGKISPTGREVAVAQPVCVLFDPQS
jgi:6-phosphogluconolactonase